MNHPKNCPNNLKFFAKLAKFRQIWSHWMGRTVGIYLPTYLRMYDCQLEHANPFESIEGNFLLLF